MTPFLPCTPSTMHPTKTATGLVGQILAAAYCYFVSPLITRTPQEILTIAFGPKPQGQTASPRTGTLSTVSYKQTLALICK